MKRSMLMGALVLAAASAASAQTGPGLDLTWHAIDCGGGVASSGALLVISAIGQDAPGAMTNGTLELRGGFLGGAGAPPPCYPDCNGDTFLNLSDFGCFQTKFALQNPYADCNGDGVRNLSDFGCFQTKFALGCP